MEMKHRRMTLVDFAIILTVTVGTFAVSENSQNKGLSTLPNEDENKGSISSRNETLTGEETIMSKLNLENPTTISGTTIDTIDSKNMSETQHPVEMGNLENSGSEKIKMNQVNQIIKPKGRSLPLESYEDVDEELEDSRDDLPPEGFPPGFFQKNFMSLRRLGEPKVIKNDSNEDVTKHVENAKENFKAKSKTSSDKLEGKVQVPEIKQAGEDKQPEGFPNDFFQQYFIGLRRLEEPTKTEIETFQIPVDTSDAKRSQLDDSTVPIGHWKHFSTIFPFPWELFNTGQSGYAYSYQQPHAHWHAYYY